MRRAVAHIAWLGLVALPISAADGQDLAAPPGGYYIGLGAGLSRAFGYEGDAQQTAAPGGAFSGGIDLDTGYSVGLAAGYDHGALRTDGELRFASLGFPSQTLSSTGGTVDFRPSDRLDLLAATANLWIDVDLAPPFPGGLVHRITPYFGGGLGAAIYDPQDDRKTRFAWQLGAGVAAGLGNGWQLSVDLRYLHAPEFSKSEGGIDMRFGPLELGMAGLGITYRFGATPPVMPDPAAAGFLPAGATADTSTALRRNPLVSQLEAARREAALRPRTVAAPSAQTVNAPANAPVALPVAAPVMPPANATPPAMPQSQRLPVPARAAMVQPAAVQPAQSQPTRRQPSSGDLLVPPEALGPRSMPTALPPALRPAAAPNPGAPMAVEESRGGYAPAHRIIQQSATR